MTNEQLKNLLQSIILIQICVIWNTIYFVQFYPEENTVSVPRLSCPNIHLIVISIKKKNV